MLNAIAESLHTVARECLGFMFGLAAGWYVGLYLGFLCGLVVFATR
jgi:hypothetical protein